MIAASDLDALLLTLKLALITALLLLLIGFPIAWGLSRMRGRVRVLLDAIIALPLVLPPTVLGFYLLMAFAPDGFLGGLWQTLFNRRLAFSFDALVIGSLFYSLPFVVQPLQQAFLRVPEHLLEVYQSMGLGLMQRIRYLVIPSCRNAIIAALSLAFAHTLGEFGVVLMIGGNIPGETQLVSIALYDHVETLQYSNAHQLSAMLVMISLSILTLTYAKIGSPFKWQNRYE